MLDQLFPADSMAAVSCNPSKTSEILSNDVTSLISSLKNPLKRRWPCDNIALSAFFNADLPEPKKMRKVQCSPKPKRSSSKYRGVCWLKKRKAWRARIEVHGKREHLGYFDSEEKAAMAYDKRAKQLSGANARLNFPFDTTETATYTANDSESSTFPLANLSHSTSEHQLPAPGFLKQTETPIDQVDPLNTLRKAQQGVIHLSPLSKWMVLVDIAGSKSFGGIYDDQMSALTTATSLIKLASSISTASPRSLFPQQNLIGSSFESLQRDITLSHLRPRLLEN